MKRALQQLASMLVALVFALGNTPALAAPPVKVTAATPSTGEQGTLDLDVVIDGGGFEPGARVDFFVTGGESDTGNVVVNSVTFNNSNKLTARVSLQNAKLADFDIKVTLLSGRNGKGITLFKVVAKKGDPVPVPIVLTEVQSSARALALKFTGTGADAYDVRYLADPIAGDCAATPVSSWTVVARAALTRPAAVGELEYFHVRPLQANTPHCVAITASYQNAWAPWTVWPSPVVTDDGQAGVWAFDVDAAMSSNSQVISRFDVVEAGQGGASEAVVGWSRNDAPSGEFAWRDGRQAFSASSFIESVRRIDVAANPSAAGSVGAVVTGSRFEGKGRSAGYVHRYLLVETSGPTSTPVVSVAAEGKAEAGGLDAEPDSPLAYVRSTNGWNPVVAIDRVVSKTPSLKRSALVIRERVNGTWVSEEQAVLTREGPDQAAGFFTDVQLLAVPDASPTTSKLVLVAPHCGMTVYAERSGGLNSPWSYFDAGSTTGTLMIGSNSGFRSVVVAYDALDGEQVVLWMPNFDGSSPALISRKASFVPLPGAPSANCGQVVPNPSVAREQVPIDSFDADLTYQGASGLAEYGSATFMSAQRWQPNTKTRDIRVLYRCSDSDAWSTASVDRTHRGPTEPVLANDGALLVAYGWGKWSRGPFEPDPYLTAPVDTMYIAREVNPCPGVP